MSAVVATVTVGVMNKVLVSLLTAGLTAVGKRAQNELFRSRDIRNATNSDLWEVLQAEVVVDEVSVAALVPLADAATTATGLQRILQDHAVNATVQQIVAAVLVEATDAKFDRIREAFRLSIANNLNLSAPPARSDELADSLFEFLEGRIRDRLEGFTSENREPMAEALAHLVLIRATVDSVEERISSLRLFSSRTAQDELEAWGRLYRTQAASYHGYITPPDFRERNPVRLEKIYVPGRIQTSLSEHRLEDPESLYDLVPRLDRDVLLGDPGGGKSTATQAITHSLAKQEDGLIPFVVILREYAPRSSDLSIVEFIETQLKTRYQAESPSGGVDSILNSGNGLVLFDGLDELLDASLRIEVAKKVEMFSSRYPQSRVFVTSRKVGYKEAKLDPNVFTVHELAGYTDEDVRTYVSKWFKLQASGVADASEPLIESFIAESDSISDLRSNPLLLALLCIIYRGQGYLPKNRIGIYEDCSKLLFQSWDRSRGIVFDFTFESHIEDALKHLAYWMFNSKDTDDGVLEDVLIRELASFFEERAFESGTDAKSAAKDFIEFCRGRAWVLSEAGTTPDGAALFKFTHRTFMEFFAASQLTRLAPEPKKLARLLLPRVARGEWDTVGQLAIHLINRSADRGAEVALEQMLTSSANRTLNYRDNVCSFIASCLDYLAIAPGLVRKAVNQSLDLALAAREGGRGSGARGAWSTLASLENRSDDTIESEFSEWLRAAFDSGDPRRVNCALFIVDRIPWSSISRRRSGRPGARQEYWHSLGSDLLTDYRAAILSSPEDYRWIGEELYWRKIIDLQELASFQSGPDSLPFDFLVESHHDPADGFAPGGVTLGWRISSYLLESGFTNPTVSPYNRRTVLEVAEDFGALLKSVPAPVVRQQRTPEIEMYFHNPSESPWESKLELPEDAVACVAVTACVYAELAAAAGWKLKNRAKSSFAALVRELANARRSGGVAAGPAVVSIMNAGLPDQALTLVDSWLAGGVSFVASA